MGFGHGVLVAFVATVFNSFVFGQSGVKNLPANISIPEGNKNGCLLYKLEMQEIFVGEQPTDSQAVTVTLNKVYPPESRAFFQFDGAELTLTGSTSSDFDFERQPTHTVEFQTYVSGRITGRYNLTINITDVNEAPYFERDVFLFTVIENKFSPFDVRAVDDDAKDVLTYSLKDTKDDSTTSPFYLEPKTNLIAMRDYDIDQSAESLFILNLTVTDNGRLVDSAILIITIENTNDNSPTCSSQTIYIPWSMPLGATIFYLLSTDMDGSAVMFSLSRDSNIDGTFSLASDGKLLLAKTPNKTAYDLVVFVVDPGNLSGECVITVNVLKSCNEDTLVSSGNTQLGSSQSNCQNDVTLYWLIPLCIAVVGCGVGIAVYFCLRKSKKKEKVEPLPETKKSGLV